MANCKNHGKGAALLRSAALVSRQGGRKIPHKNGNSAEGRPCRRFRRRPPVSQKKDPKCFGSFFCALVCNLSRFDGVFSSCARDFLPRRVVPAASYWRAAAVTRAPALLLFRRKYRLRRKVFLCRRVVLFPPRRDVPAASCGAVAPRNLSRRATRGGEDFFRKILSFGKKRETGVVCPPEKFQTARRGRLFFGKFCPFGKIGETGAVCPPKKS